MPRKDKIVTPSVTEKLQIIGYNVADWDDSKTASKLNSDIIDALSKSSKQKNGKEGYPDRIYFDKENKLLILVEEKPTMKEHNLEEVDRGAVSGIKWFLSFFKKETFKSYKILGIAVSGNILNEYEHKFDCFIIKNNNIELLPQIRNFLKKEDFLAIFNNFDEEKAIENITKVSKKINTLLRNIDSQKRPILLSALMISLYKPKNFTNDFVNIYKTLTGETILELLYSTVSKILMNENIPEEKIKVLKGELASISNDQTLKKTDILKDILIDLDTNVIPLFDNSFSTNSNYDIMGKFYEEFLRYAGITNVKKGIILTPRHITTLFTNLIPIKSDDVILDLCCGTGAFLIAGMNKIISLIQNSDRSDKVEAISNVKEKQLIGFELNTTMYICAISNMLFRGDGKSNIYNYDSINDADKKVDNILKEKKPTIGFINPPYSGKETKENPTPKEITFLRKMLENCSRYGIIIAPLSMYFKDDEVRENILKKHTLKSVINMPKDLFQPNASTHTAIAIFETNIPHDYNNEVAFYDLRDDGLVLTKNKGRIDLYNKWKDIEIKVLNSLKNNNNDDNIISMKKKIKKGDEWTVYAHSKNDYKNLSKKFFINTILEYIVYKFKRNNNLLDKEINIIEFMSILKKIEPNLLDLNLLDDLYENEILDTENWGIFKVKKQINSDTLFVKTTSAMIETQSGTIPYISRSAKNNGLSDFVSLFDIRKNEDYELNKKNCITIGAEGVYAFYQDEDFITGVKVYTLSNPKLNKYNAMFLITMLNIIDYKYSYGRARTKNRIENEEILLPKNIDGNVDWDYMENYIKSLPYSNFL